MKSALKCCLFFLLTISLFACNNDDDEPTVADYSVLGISSVTINGKQFEIKNSLMLDIADNDSITITGTQYVESTKHSQVEYAILMNPGTTLSVEVNTNYPEEVSIVSDMQTKDNRQVCTIDITRTGYQEHLTYSFSGFPVQ